MKLNKLIFIVIIINYKLRVSLLCLLFKILLFKKCQSQIILSKNQIILFLFFQPTDPLFFAVLPIDQKINLVSLDGLYFVSDIQVNFE